MPMTIVHTAGICYKMLLQSDIAFAALAYHQTRSRVRGKLKGLSRHVPTLLGGKLLPDGHKILKLSIHTLIGAKMACHSL